MSGYLMSQNFAERVKATVLKVDGMPQGGGLHKIQTRFEDGPSGGGVRLSRGTFTGSWAVGETKAVTIQGGTQTISVTNYCVPVSANTASTQTYNVIFGAVMGTQTAVEVQAGGMQTGTTSGPWNKDTTATINGVSDIRNYWGNVASGKRVGFQMAADGHYYLVVAEC